jgi:hypothetical protein
MWLCENCHAQQERERRANSPEAIASREALARERERIQAQREADARRPPNPEIYCAIGGTAHGGAWHLRDGVPVCATCASRPPSNFDDPRGRYGTPLVLVLEAKVAELEQRIAALEAAPAALQAPKASRKGGAQ